MNKEDSVKLPDEIVSVPPSLLINPLLSSGHQYDIMSLILTTFTAGRLIPSYSWLMLFKRRALFLSTSRDGQIGIRWYF